ncbi:MAG: O-antigen ligase family protein [Calditrichae bacterium]|nr:O-antigen ligase family protein [Calditrichia bacterium]
MLILIPVSATIYMTQTRAVFIALVVSIIISILMLFRFKLIRFSYIMRLLFLILPFILIYLIRAHFIEIDYNKNIISRFTTSKSLLQDSSVIARFYSSYEAYNLIRTSPILGVGYGQEIIIVPEWLAGYESRSYYIDNSLITIAVKSGLLGFLGLLFFFFLFYYKSI